jgi:hypothetical protein
MALYPRCQDNQDGGSHSRRSLPSLSDRECAIRTREEFQASFFRLGVYSS